MTKNKTIPVLLIVLLMVFSFAPRPTYAGGAVSSVADAVSNVVSEVMASPILSTVAMVAISYYTFGAYGYAGFGVEVGQSAVTNAATFSPFFGAGAAFETLGVATAINAITADIILCVTGVAFCSDEDGSNAGAVSTPGASTPGVSTGQPPAPGDTCYSQQNACGQAYVGVIGYADDGTTLTCYQSNAPTVVLSPTPPPDTECATTDGSCAVTHYDCSAGTSANPVANADSWTWGCNGINGGSNASCSEARSWTEYCTGANGQYPWQIWRYDNSRPATSEYVRTDLSTCGPLARMDGSCNPTHWGCNAGTSANNTGGTTGPWTWSCKGANGGLDVSCAQSNGTAGALSGAGTSGTGTGSSGSCIVKKGIAQRLCSGSAPGSSLVSYDNCGTEISSAQCSYGCSAGACNPPPPISFTSFQATNHKGSQATFTATGGLQVRPVLVLRGDPTWVYWNVQDASSCTVSGTNGDSWSDFSSTADGKQSQPIQGHTVFTLRCTPLLGAQPPNEVTQTQAVDIAPIFQEL